MDSQVINSFLRRERECVAGRVNHVFCESDLLQFSTHHVNRDSVGPFSSTLFNPYAVFNNSGGLDYFPDLQGFTFKAVSKNMVGQAELILFEQDDEETGQAFVWCGAMAGIALNHMHACNSCIDFLGAFGTEDTTTAMQSDSLVFPMPPLWSDAIMGLVDQKISDHILSWQPAGQCISLMIPGQSPFLFLTAFGPDTWALSGFSLFLCAILSAILVIPLHDQPFSQSTSKTRVLIEYVSLCMNQSVTDYLLVRINLIIFAVWLAACFILTQNFQGGMFDLMAKSFEPYIAARVEDLLRYPFQSWKAHMLATGMDEISFREQPGADQVDAEGRIVLYDIYDFDSPGFISGFIGKVFEGGHVLFCSEALFFCVLWPIRQQFDSKFLQTIHISPPLVVDQAYMGVRPAESGTHPDFRRSMESILVALTEAGLMEYWTENNLAFMRRSLPRLATEAYDDLEPRDLMGIAMTATACLMCCVIVFLAELIISCAEASKQKKRKRSKFETQWFVRSSSPRDFHTLPFDDQVVQKFDYKPPPPPRPVMLTFYEALSTEQDTH